MESKIIRSTSRRERWQNEKTLKKQSCCPDAFVRCCNSAIIGCDFFVNSELMRRKLRENTLALNEKLLIQTENKIKDYSENLNNIAMVMAYSPTTEQFFEQDSLGRVMVQNSLMEVLSNTMLLNEDIVGIYLFDKNQSLLVSIGKRLSSERLLVEANESNRFGNLFCPEEGDHYYYTAAFPIYDLNSSVYGKKIGTSIFVMKTDGMESMLKGSGATESVNVYLIDKTKKLWHHPNYHNGI